MGRFDTFAAEVNGAAAVLSSTTLRRDQSCECRRNEAHDRALTTAFLRAGRRPGAAVVAVNDRVVMTTAPAAAHAAVRDHASLLSWARARRAGGRGRRGEIMSDGDHVPVGARCEAVTVDELLAGFLIDLDPEPQAETTADAADFTSALTGESSTIRDARTQLSRLVGTSTRVLIVGAPGTGKITAARRLLDLEERAFDEFDCADSIAAGWLSSLSTSLRSAAGVVLAHLDEVADAAIPAMTSILADTASGCRVVATTSTEDMDCPIARTFAARVTLPTLRDRPEDLPEIAATILARHAVRGQSPRLAPDARRLLWSYQWPGNTAELELVLSRAVRAAPAAVIDESCLCIPHGGRSSVTRRRTAVLAAERDAVMEALARCDNNKLAAADLLGIARSTLYRKLRALAIP